MELDHFDPMSAAAESIGDGCPEAAIDERAVYRHHAHRHKLLASAPSMVTPRWRVVGVPVESG